MPRIPPGDADRDEILKRIEECRAAEWTNPLLLYCFRVLDTHLEWLASQPGVTALTELNIASARVTHLGLKHLTGLHSLSELHLGHVKSLNDESLRYVGQLTSLTRLHLGGTRITDNGLRYLAALPNLQSINLENCKRLTDPSLLEAVFGQCPHFRRICLQGAYKKGVLPKRLYRNDASDSKTVFEQIRLQYPPRTRPIPRVKIMVLGSGGVGKSDLVARMRSAGRSVADAEMTHGFEIHDLPITVNRSGHAHEINCEVLDFGGQPELHSSHRLFLQPTLAVYILVLNSAFPHNHPINRCEYWLRLVKREAGDAPAIVVCTHADLPDSGNLSVSDVRRLADEIKVNLKDVVSGYANRPRADFAKLSIADRYAQIIEAIRQAISSIEHLFKDKCPDGFLKLMAFAEGRGNPTDFPGLQIPSVNYKYFQTTDFAKAALAVSGSSAGDSGFTDAWFQQLRDMGSFHYVGDLKTVLAARNPQNIMQYCFNPKWVKSPVYHVIRAMLARNDTTRGIVTEKDLRRFIRQRHREAAAAGELWGNVTWDEPADLDLLIELMRACELLFDVSDRQGDRFLVPDWLILNPTPLSQRHGYEVFPALTYQFLPESLLLRFIGRWYAYVQQGYVWRNQVSIARQDAVATIRADSSDRTVTIAIHGNDAAGRGYLYRQIAEELQQIEPCDNLDSAISRLQAPKVFSAAMLSPKDSPLPLPKDTSAQLDTLNHRICRITVNFIAKEIRVDGQLVKRGSGQLCYLFQKLIEKKVGTVSAEELVLPSTKSSLRSSPSMRVTSALNKRNCPRVLRKFVKGIPGVGGYSLLDNAFKPRR